MLSANHTGTSCPEQILSLTEPQTVEALTRCLTSLFLSQPSCEMGKTNSVKRQTPLENRPVTALDKYGQINGKRVGLIVSCYALCLNNRD